MVFDHDWWFAGGFDRQRACAMRRCAEARFSENPADLDQPNTDASRFLSELETRTVVYLRDGFSYELRCPVDIGTSSYLSFECVPAEDVYKVGTFILSVPFEELCRIETYAFHPSERPEEAQMIKGFSGGRMPVAGRPDDRATRSDPREMDTLVT